MEKFDLEKLKQELEGKTYKIIYINYDKEKGIEIAENINNLKNSLNDFYKIYIFNDEFMYTILKFDDDDFKIDKIKKDELENCEEKEIYLEKSDITKIEGNKNYTKIKLRLGIIKGTKIEKIQYIDLI